MKNWTSGVKPVRPKENELSSSQCLGRKALFTRSVALERTFALILLCCLYGNACEAYATENPVTNTDTSAGEFKRLEAKGWKPRVHFKVIEPQEFVEKVDGIVEVVELFLYDCEHCYVFEPQFSAWKVTQGKDVSVVLVPANFGKSPRSPQLYAHLFYTLEALERKDLHQVVYDTIHKDKNGLAASTDEESMKRFLQFAKKHGIDEYEFKRAYNSELVAMKLARAERLTRLYKVASVPTIVVNGRYQSDAQQAGSQARLIAITEDLVTEQQSQ